MPWLIFAVALAVRLIHLWQIRPSPFFDVLLGDAAGYDEWARRLAAGDWIGTEVFYQAPLYPYFAGLVYAVFGHDLLVLRVCQAVIGSASCVLLGLAGARLFSKPVGLIAGLALALYAPAIFFDGLIQKSVLDMFFVCLALWLVSVLLTGAATPATWPALGLAMGGLALTRENALVFIAVIVAWIIVRARTGTRPPGTSGTSGTLGALRPLGTFALGLAIVLLPVAARNYAVGGGFYLTTSQFGPNLYIGNNPGADGTYASIRSGRGAPEFERQDAREVAEQAAGRALSPAEVSSYWTEQAVEFITSQPGAWLRLTGRKIALLFNSAEMLDTESQESYAEWSLPLRLGGVAGHFGVLVPLAAFGLIATWHQRRRLWVLHALALAYAASVVMFYVFARYRYPLVPFLMLYAAAGLAIPFDWRSWRPAAVMAAVVAVAVFANWPLLSTSLMRAITETNLAAALQAQGRYDEAVAHYQRALAHRDTYAPAYNNLGTALRAQGKLDEAIAQYRRALSLQPDFPDARFNLANAEMAKGQPLTAIEQFREALKREPDSVETHTNLAIALEASGDANGAIAEFREALRLSPRASRSHRNLGNALANAGDGRGALDHLSQAVALDGADAGARYDLGSLLLELQQFREAAGQFEAALKLDPASAEAMNNLGIALASQGRLADALGWFERALSARPDFADARANRDRARAALAQR
ncbi:MAG: tetratricopeptide repeat protein [Vicinamibacterales bacterium]